MLVMKKILLWSIFVLLTLVFISPKLVRAQSPLNCGLLNESCCNVPGYPNSCKAGVGLVCKNNVCVSDGTNSNPPKRGSVDTTTGSTTTVSVDVSKCDNGDAGIQTAIGCIPVFNQTDFLSAILKWAVGIGGGIAFLLIVYAGFMIMTASGNPERLKAGQELLTSAISGLILLVFSIFILKFIGIDILGLGAFGFGKSP